MLGEAVRGRSTACARLTPRGADRLGRRRAVERRGAGRAAHRARRRTRSRAAKAAGRDMTHRRRLASDAGHRSAVPRRRAGACTRYASGHGAPGGWALHAASLRRPRLTTCDRRSMARSRPRRIGIVRRDQTLGVRRPSDAARTAASRSRRPQSPSSDHRTPASMVKSALHVVLDGARRSTRTRHDVPPASSVASTVAWPCSGERDGRGRHMTVSARPAGPRAAAASDSRRAPTRAATCDGVGARPHRRSRPGWRAARPAVDSTAAVPSGQTGSAVTRSAAASRACGCPSRAGRRSPWPPRSTPVAWLMRAWIAR